MTAPNVTGNTSIKYPKPKIIAIDLEGEVSEGLRAAGFNIRVGSFGQPYRAEARAGHLWRLSYCGSLPNYEEQEIVIIDLAWRPPADNASPANQYQVEEDQPDWWVKPIDGIVDPRCRSAAVSGKAFTRIQNSGGIFIVFADLQIEQSMQYGHMEGGYGLVPHSAIRETNWSFLEMLKLIEIKNCGVGEEVSPSPIAKVNFRKLCALLENSWFRCTFDPSPYSFAIDLKDDQPASARTLCLTLAHNKYGDRIALWLQGMEPPHGMVIILPQVEDKLGILKHLIGELLPEYQPSLFPHIEAKSWVEDERYELTSVRERRKLIEAIATESEARIDVVRSEIASIRETHAHLFNILTETGDALVKAVKATFDGLGFRQVVDMDAEADRQNGERGKQERKREDLQIRDGSPLLLVEVKGISGKPIDTDATRAADYIAPRIKDDKRFDVVAMSIINHQRSMPPLDRDREKVFHADVILNAEERDLGLLTTWDLHRLARSFELNGWKHENIQPLFYRTGVIDPVPIHYEFVGVVEGYIAKHQVVGVRINGANISAGDRIAFELPTEFVEQSIVTLEVANQPVPATNTGDQAGTKTNYSRSLLKNGVRVFRVVQELQPADAAVDE